MTSSSPQTTDFSRDVLGRYFCNGLDEAMASTQAGSTRPDAHPFDIVIVGGGTFGGALAQHVFFADRAHSHRVLVLEGGPFMLSGHTQNYPVLGLNPAAATSIQDLRAIGQDRVARAEVWGLAWHSPVKFPGLAYCVGGRSLYWGGWSPRPLDTELRPNLWPAATLADLSAEPLGYYRQSSDQIGVTDSNYFLFGQLQEALRARIRDVVEQGLVADAIPPSQLPDHPALLPGTVWTADQLRELLGFQQGGGPADAGVLRELLRVEAPLGVEVRAPSGEFPGNKFSSVPLLFEAARSAYVESQGDDSYKRLMVVPNCHVKRLLLDANRVIAIETGQGTIGLPAGGTVVIALGTVESTRLALNSFQGTQHYGQIGLNLIAHLRSNLAIRIPRASLGVAAVGLQASALFVKGRHTFAGGTLGHYHLQVTASGLGAVSGDSEADLFKLIPDLDTLEAHRQASEEQVVITIRGIGEMTTDNPGSFVRLDQEVDEFGVPRAFVAMAPSANDQQLWNVMDQAADDLAQALANGQHYEILTPAGPRAIGPAQAPKDVLAFVNRRDGLGTTHHEAGTLRMGADPARSATDPDCRVHDVANAFVAAPAVFPCIGSPNPMLTGVALTRRLGDRITTQPAVPVLEQNFVSLFNGTSMSGWQMAGTGRFALIDGTLASVPGGGDLGLLWYTIPLPADFVLRLDFRLSAEDNNSGVFLRFPDPRAQGYNNQAWVGVRLGYEVQVDETARPDGAPIHHTGAIYGEPRQDYHQPQPLVVGDWNSYEIRVEGPTYTVHMNGALVTTFDNQDPARGQPSSPQVPTYMGMQAESGQVSFRNIRVLSLAPAPVRAPAAVPAKAGHTRK